MNNQQDHKTFEEDGIRPIASGEIEIADTFEEDGIRPIAESPDFLVRDSQSEKTDQSTATSSLDADRVIEVEEDRL
jgi:hypothetical protein